MKYVVRVGVLGWIDSAGPWPLHPGVWNGIRQGYDALQIKPAWIVNAYMGLIATSNARPIQNPLDFKQYRRTQDFRTMLWARLLFDDSQPGKTGPVGATYYNSDSLIVDAGTTPPINFAKLPVMLPAALRFQSIRSRSPHAGELSPISSVCLTGRHPNSAFGPVAANERLIANGVIRFRAGAHTDSAGVDDAGAAFHVPWVWAEFLLTSLGGGKVRLRGASSIFPNVAWYINDIQQTPINHQATDSIFPVSQSGLVFDTINVHALKIWPVLSAGAPESMAEPKAIFDKPFMNKTVPITKMPWTCPGGPVMDVVGYAEAQSAA